jgi:3-oxoacyl-[acyl-carrier-protein] synthase-3
VTTLSSTPALIGARVAGVGAARPSHSIGGAELTAPFGKTAEWLRARTGIDSIRRLSPGETILDLAETAARAALGVAHTSVAAVDTVIVATCSSPSGPGQQLSTQLAQRLGFSGQATDLNAACAGFSYALSCAAAAVRTGQANTVLVVAAEQMSSMIDPQDLGTSILFGDGAGAAVVSGCTLEQDGIAAPAWSSDGALRDVLEIPSASRTLKMNGQAVFRWAIQAVPPIVSRALGLAGVSADDLDVFVPHQANLRIIESIAREANLEHCLIATDVCQAGNTSAASIPLALTRLQEAGRTHSGALALIVGFGAGLSISGQVIRLP